MKCPICGEDVEDIADDSDSGPIGWSAAAEGMCIHMPCRLDFGWKGILRCPCGEVFDHSSEFSSLAYLTVHLSELDQMAYQEHFTLFQLGATITEVEA